VAYRISAEDPTMEAAVRRIGAEQIEAALATLDDAAADREEAIHDVRKRCKKLRSLVRLVRPVFPAYRDENAAFRDAAAVLAGTRDADAMIAAYDALCEASADRLHRPDVAGIRRRLTEERKHAADPERLAARLDDFRGRMRAARRRVDGWTVEADGFEAVAGGVAKTYKRGRKALAHARHAPGDEAVHDWRKRVKHHRQHARLLRDLWRPALDAREDAAHALGDLLGDHHDLAVLRAHIEADRARFERGADVASFLDAIAHRQDALAAAAFGCGERLYAEKTKALTKRWQAYWRVWRDPTAAVPAAA
jgi:CHAD domain-containing protein